MASSRLPSTPEDLQSELQQIEENYRTLLKVTTSRALVAQTPKQVIWTLTKPGCTATFPLYLPSSGTRFPCCSSLHS